MSFANLYFIFLFLPVVTILYYWFKKYRLFILIISSQLFYFYEGLDALVFLNLAILISYYAKKNIKLSLIFLFSTLFFFKYSFHLSTLFDFKILNFFSLKIDLKNTTVFAGLSFYTFQLAGYLLEKKKDLSLKELFLFTSFFPQIVAGPIIKKKLFVDNLKNMEKGEGEDKKNGYRQLFFVEYLPKFLLFFSYGLFYKIVCADILSIFSENYSTYIEQASTNNDNINIYIFIFYAFAYGFRIYFDFAGYSLMAIGIGYLFNFKLPKNFDEPYKKLSIKDFWRHWHITLSMWFRDHIFNFRANKIDSDENMVENYIDDLISKYKIQGDMLIIDHISSLNISKCIQIKNKLIYIPTIDNKFIKYI